MTSAHYDLLLRQWGEWSRTGVVIPKRLECAIARWQFEVPSDYPEEPEPREFSDVDDDTMSRVDRAICSLRDSHVREYVVILHVYRNKRQYAKAVEDEAIAAFGRAYESLSAPRKRSRYA